METKQEILSGTLALIGAPGMENGPGSKEPKGYLIAIVGRFNLGIDTRLPKPGLAEAIARAAGVGWDAACWSSGSTVTHLGLTRMRDTVQILLGRP